jgi:phosphoglycolate phosphatase-like HAD superfamily hydrolase
MSDVIALIFDFDDTLASDSTSGFLESMGVDTASFWKDEVDPLLSQQDWDPVPAYLYQMIQLSQSGKHGLITQQRLKDWGARLELHDGVPTLFQRLRAAVRAEQPQVQLEFYLISSGIGDVVRSTPIAHEFTDKTRYLFHIQKGIIGRDFRNKPFEVNRKVPEDRLRVPFDQMVFVGDGYTDIPCFSLIRRAGGFAFGVWDPKHRDKRSRAWGFIEEGRVSNLNQARYDEHAELYQWLEEAVTSLAGRIALKSRVYRG